MLLPNRLSYEGGGFPYIPFTLPWRMNHRVPTRWRGNLLLLLRIHLRWAYTMIPWRQRVLLRNTIGASSCPKIRPGSKRYGGSWRGRLTGGKRSPRFDAICPTWLARCCCCGTTSDSLGYLSWAARHRSGRCYPKSRGTCTAVGHPSGYSKMSWNASRRGWRVEREYSTYYRRIVALSFIPLHRYPQTEE